ncbi:MAG: DUF3179 domain-containing (seleno)protein [Actinomycetota bacterium]
MQLVPRDLIAPIYEPRFHSAAESAWPDDTDVIGVEIGGEARAYPVSLLNSRELVIDEVGGVPVAITWCPVCATAAVHDRRLGDETLVFGTQGALYRNAMTWWDHDSGSIWSQPFGEAIAGPRTGATVDQLPSQLTTWGAWRGAHPATIALDARGAPVGVDLSQLLIVVQLADETRGYSINRVRDVGVVNDTVGGVDIAVLVDPVEPERWSVWRRTLTDTTVELAQAGDQVTDEASGSRIDPNRGLVLDGPLAGETLGRVPATTSISGFGPTDRPVFATLWPDATVWAQN